MGVRLEHTCRRRCENAPENVSRYPPPAGTVLASSTARFAYRTAHRHRFDARRRVTTNRSQDAPVNNERRPIVVLLVDDQRFVGMAVGLLLGSEADIQLHCCHAAGEALATANRVSPTVILQDLVMPDIDGATLVG